MSILAVSEDVAVNVYSLITFVVAALVLTTLTGLKMILNHKQTVWRMRLDAEPRVTMAPPKLFTDPVTINVTHDETFGGDQDPFLFRWKGEEIYTVHMLTDAIRNLQNVDEARVLRRLVQEHGWGQGGIESAVRDVYPFQLEPEIAQALIEEADAPPVVWRGGHIYTWGDLGTAMEEIITVQGAVELKKRVAETGWHSETIPFVLQRMDTSDMDPDVVAVLMEEEQ